jgi:hypothetical protein
MSRVDCKSRRSFFHNFFDYFMYSSDSFWRRVVEKLQHESGGKEEMSSGDSNDDEERILRSFQRRQQDVDENRAGEEGCGQHEKPLQDGDWNRPQNRHRNVDSEGVAVEADDRQKAGNVRSLCKDGGQGCCQSLKNSRNLHFPDQGFRRCQCSHSISALPR